MVRWFEWFDASGIEPFIFAKIARKNCKISGIAARRAPKNCVNSVSMRSRNRRTLLQFLTEFQVRSNEKTRASGVDVTQILRESPAKKLQMF